MSLKIGKQYNLYTNYSTIVNQKVEVVAILSYDECAKVSYDMSILAINERVISVKDEDIEEAIGNDNIYHCRALESNSDGTHTEYLVWDSIINDDKTTLIGEDYTCQLTINIGLNSSVSISQILNTIQQSVSSNYGGAVKLSITTPTEAASKEDDDELSEEKLNTVKSIINSINLWESKLIPAVEKLTNSGLESTIDSINENLAQISSNISMVKHGL